MFEETTENGMMIERVKELRDRVKKANDSPWITGAYEHDVETMNEAIAALERPSYWQTIGTAPTDGTPILVFCPTFYQGQGGQRVASWIDFSDYPGWYSHVSERLTPTHWMPLPDPPDTTETDHE